MMGRSQFRAHALDGAQLYFQPASGVHVRVATAATAGLRRRAPRVAMFGITNACNLACDFCSRDVARPSAWTVATAAAALRGLHDAGTLEVAYGGGEPFAFRGFAELVAELDATTTLAQHVTTNGTLIDDAMWARYAGRFGMVRLSIYDETWRAAAATLSAYGQRWGANVLVDRAALATLPARLAALAAAGCHDVSLLAYVGPDAARHLDAAGDRRLAAVIAASPLPCRVSVCFGDRLAVPRLFADDCGAGRDFISITPDRRVQSCSFQDRSLPGATADEILAAWRLHQPSLAAPSPRRGCARVLPLAADAPPPPPIAIWRSFSGNNSGECFLVARFRELADAEAYLAELAPGYTPDAPHSPAWRTLFAEQQVSAARTDDDDNPNEAPRELLAIGRTVLAVHYDAGDILRELRALAWKRGAFVVPGGIHIHDGVTLLAAIRCRGDDDRDELLTAPAPPDTRRYPHGDVVFVTMPILAHESPIDTLDAARAAFLALAGERRFALELRFDELTDDAFVAAKRHLGHRRAERPRLSIYFWGPERDTLAARMLDLCGADRTTLSASTLLVDPAPDRKRLAVLAYRRGGYVTALDGDEVEVGASIWFDPPPPQKGRRAEPRLVDVPRFEADLRAALPRGTDLTVTNPDRSWRRGPDVTIRTTTPGPLLAIITAQAAALGANVSPWVRDLDPLGAALHRLLDDVH